MKKIFLATLLFTLTAHAQFAHRQNPGTIGGTEPTIAATGACPSTGCVTINTQGASVVVATITASGSCPGANCTLTFACSKDNWATSTAVNADLFTGGALSGSPASTTIVAGTFVFPTFAYPACGVYASSYTSGTATVNLQADPAFLPNIGATGAAAQQVQGSGVPGTPANGVLSVETPNVSSTGTISASCATPATGCSAGQFVSLKLGGRSSVTATVTPSNFTGTLQAYCSGDDGTNWDQIQLRPVSGRLSSNTGITNSQAFAGSSTVTFISLTLPLTGCTDVMVADTAAVTNTASVRLSAYNTNPQAWSTVVALKGSQASTNSGSLGISTQDLKDAGRSSIVINVDAATPANTDTLLTFQKNVDGTVTGSLTSLAVTNAKTWRMQTMECSYVQSGATAAKVDVHFRRNNAGACTAGSGLVASCELSPQVGTAAANTGADHCRFVIPDGYEIIGDGTKSYCLSAVASTSAGTLSCNIFGYEY